MMTMFMTSLMAVDFCQHEISYRIYHITNSFHRREDERPANVKSHAYHLGLVARKPVFGVSDKVRFKPACSATETS